MTKLEILGKKITSYVRFPQHETLLQGVLFPKAL